jgi:hypothetical protein
MSKIVKLQTSVASFLPAEPPRRASIRRRSRFFATLFSVALVLAVLFAVALVLAVALYNGPLLAYGPGGVRFAPPPEEAAHLTPLSSFSFAQRLTGAAALSVLIAPVIFVFAHLRGLFRLYADGVVFAQTNARHIKAIGVGLIAYAFAPFFAHHLIRLVGVTSDPVWFHLDEVQALVAGALLFIIAEVVRFGGEIEYERDGFI